MAIRLTLLMKKVDTISHEEFHNYWSGPHAEIFLALPIVKEKVLKYSQFHVEKALSDEFAAFGLPMADFDGGVNIWVNSTDDLKAIFQDLEYPRVVVQDGAVFSKTTESKGMIGYDKDFVADGKGL